MKKLIQICSFLALVVVFTAVSANAQSTYGSEVEIPFSFNVRDCSYEAGKYIVKLSKMETGVAVLTIGDPRTDSVQTFLTQRNAESGEESVKLVFETLNGGKVLSRIMTPAGGYALRRTREQRQVVASIARGEIVNTSVNLF